MAERRRILELNIGIEAEVRRLGRDRFGRSRGWSRGLRVEKRCRNAAECGADGEDMVKRVKCLNLGSLSCSRMRLKSLYCFAQRLLEFDNAKRYGWSNQFGCPILPPYRCNRRSQTLSAFDELMTGSGYHCPDFRRTKEYVDGIGDLG